MFVSKIVLFRRIEYKTPSNVYRKSPESAEIIQNFGEKNGAKSPRSSIVSREQSINMYALQSTINIIIIIITIRDVISRVKKHVRHRIRLRRNDYFFIVSRLWYINIILLLSFICQPDKRVCFARVFDILYTSHLYMTYHTIVISRN